MTIERKVGMGIAGQPSGATDVEKVFSTYLYTGNSNVGSVVNDIDLSGKGGMVWIRARNYADNHVIMDTERGGTKSLRSNNINGEATASNLITSFNSDGFTRGNNGSISDAHNFVSWTFGKKRKFFDVVTYTGNGVAGRTIAHGLGGTVGMILVKRRDANSGWRVYHRGANGGTYPERYYAMLQATTAFGLAPTVWNNTAPTDSVFTVGTDTDTNVNNGTFVAYVFADNSSEDAEEQMIKCGYYFGNANANGPIVNLGWEPQWLLIRPSSTNNWLIYDNIRGVPNASSSYNSGKSQELWPNLNSAEDWDGNNANKIEFNATGFQIKSASATHNKTSDDKGHLYMAIRAPMMKEPEAATDVFALDYAGANGDGKEPNYRSTFPVDFALHVKTGNGGPQAYSRVTGPMYLYTDSSNDEGETSQSTWDFTNGWWNQNSNQSTSNGQTAGLWKRAKGFFDVVAYTGNATARVIPHSLGVVPEMIWVKKRSAAKHWSVWHKDLTSTSEFLSLNNNWADTGNSNIWNNGVDHTSTTFSIHTTGYVNSANSTYISYHFASLAGISKVGSFTGNGTGQNIDCGFSNGAKWVLLKNISATHGWHLFDTTRGIVTGNDPYKLLNTNASQYTNVDMIDPYESGFAVTDHGEINGNGNTIIFYAIA